MLARIASSTSSVALRQKVAASRVVGTAVSRNRTMVSIKDSPEASIAYQKSCYFEIDFTINDGLPVGEAIKKFSAFDIGALVTVDDSGALTGVISERDIVTKVGLLDKSYDTVIKEVSTQTARLVTATLKDSVDDCMKKLLDKNIRHLPLLNDEGKVIGMVSQVLQFRPLYLAFPAFVSLIMCRNFEALCEGSCQRNAC